MPKVSVIVPVYKVEAYVEKCLRSILGQTYQDMEVLAVDDGSPDGSGDICERLAQEDSRLRVIHQENQGLGGARNTGIQAAAGEWLLLVDSDDWLEPGILEQALAAGEKHGADMVMFAFQTVDEQGRVLREFVENVPLGQPLSPQGQGEVLFTAPCAWNKLYKAELFKKTGVAYPPQVWYEDVRTTPKLMAASRCLVFLDCIGYNYLQRQGSIMSNLQIGRNAEILEAFDDVLGYFKEKGLFGQYKDELCYLTLYHTYLTASVRVIRIDRKSPLLGEFRGYIQQAFPEYRQNRYLPRLTKNQRLLFFLLEKKQYWLIALLFKLKG